MTRTATAAAALMAALALAACGKDSGDPIPAKQAQALLRGLDTAQRQADSGTSCGTLLNTTIPALEDRATGIRKTVGSDTRETIRDGIAHLRQLATEQCNQKQQEQLPATSDTTTSETTTSDTTTSETTTQTTDTTTDTSTETTPPTTETTPPTTETTPPPTTPGPNGGTPPGANPNSNGGIQP
jgi:hypothetical protein